MKFLDSITRKDLHIKIIIEIASKTLAEKDYSTLNY
jgi:hypothetical protein